MPGFGETKPMAAKAKIVVTHYTNPVSPVVIEQGHASNLQFGELTRQHARRERRRRRKAFRGGHPRGATMLLG